METLSNNATRLIGPLCAGSLYAFVGYQVFLSSIIDVYFCAQLIFRFKDNTNKKSF